MSRKWVSKVFLESCAVGSVYCLRVKHYSFHYSFPNLKTMFYFFRKEQAPSIVSTPSNPLYLVKNDNITLWRTYTLDGTPLDEVEVIFIPDSPSFSAQRVARFRSRGTTQVADDFQDRFVVIFSKQPINNANPSLAKIRQQNEWIECVPTKWN